MDSVNLRCIFAEKNKNKYNIVHKKCLKFIYSTLRWETSILMPMQNLDATLGHLHLGVTSKKAERYPTPLQ